MPSPFPGMDPYLEHPLLWPILQQYFIGTLADLLGEGLPRRYAARIKEYTYWDNSTWPEKREETDSPPGCTLPGGNRPTPRNQPRPSEASPVWNIPTAAEEIRDYYLEIVLPVEPYPVLAVIEFLTPSHKTPGSEGWKQYRTRRAEFLAANVHLLEIDLLRAGQHTILAPQQKLLRRGRYHYLISLCRAGGREFCEVWGILLQDRLPKITIPLLDEPDLVVDLQPLLDRCYDDGGFARQTDYDHDPYYPLAPADARWAEEILQAAGLRS